MASHNAPRRVDLAGMTFGQWTVIEVDRINSNRGVIWRCRCACGAVRTVPGQRLRQGQSKSCRSCALKKSKRPVDLTGQLFGRWTVLRFAQKGDDRQRYWECRCECGALH